MINYTNAKIIADRTKFARRASLGGLAVMMPGLFLGIGGLFNPSLQSSEFILISYVSLILGTIIATIGGRLAEHWLVEPRNDQRLEKVLKRLDKRYRLINYYTPVEHLLLTPTGLFAIIMKDESGPIRFDGKRWSQPPSLTRLWRDWRHGGLGDPTGEAAAQIKRLKAQLKDRVPDAPIDALVVFTNPAAELSVPEDRDDIMLLNDLKDYLAAHTTPALPGPQYRALAEAVTPAEAAADDSDDESTTDEEAVPAAPKSQGRRKRRRQANETKP